MLNEARATKYVYDASNDALTLTADNAGNGGAAGKTANVTLLLDAEKKLVGVDLRATSVDCVLMVGAHEDVASQVPAEARVDLDSTGALAGIRIAKASRAIDAPAKSPYF